MPHLNWFESTQGQVQNDDQICFEVTSGVAARTSEEILAFKILANLKDSFTIRKKLFVSSNFK